MQNKLIQTYIGIEGSRPTLRKSYRRQLQTDELGALTRLVASFAHEINNPLAGVLVYTRLLYKKISNDNISKGIALDYLSRMDNELTRTTELIRELKDFAWQSKSPFQELDINQVVKRTLDCIADSVEENHIHVIKQLGLALPVINGNIEQLQRALLNLILNAIEAMPGGGTLSVRSYKCGTYLKVEIQDTGRGISCQNLPKLFTPFFSTKSEVKGVGLGLAVVYGIIKRHGGNIEIQSQVGEGSTFTINIPVPARGKTSLSLGITG
jgi:two-component system NtrC family sensor kinase